MAGEASGVKAGQAYVELSLRDKMSAGLVAAKQQFAGFIAGVAKLGGGLAGGMAGLLSPLGIGEAIKGALNVPGLLGGGVREFMTQGGALADMSDRTGASAETLTSLGYAAKQTGVDLGSLEAGMRGMAKLTGALAGGNEQAAATLAKLGISSSAFLAASPEQRFGMLADGLSRISDPGLKASLAMKTLGKAGVDLLPMLKDGSSGLDAFRAEAERLGLIIGSDQVEAADKLGDAYDGLTAQFRVMMFQIGAALAGPLTELIQMMQSGASVVIQFVKNNAAAVRVIALVAVGVMVLGTALLALAGAGWLASAAVAGLSAIATIASGVWTIFTGIAAAASAVNTWLAATMTAEGLAALWASIQTWLLNAALSVTSVVSGIAAAALAALASPLGLLALGLATVAALLVVGAGYWLFYSESGQQAVRDLVGALGRLWSIATETIGGIFDAIVAGNWGLAMRIATAGMALAWAQFVAWLETGWIGVVGALSDGWVRLKTFAVASVFEMIAAVGRGLGALQQMIVGWANAIAAALGFEGGFDGIDAISQFSDGLASVAGNRANAARAEGSAQIGRNQAERLRDVAAANNGVKTAQAELDALVAQARSEREAQVRKRQDELNKNKLGFSTLEGSTPAGTLGTFSGAVAGLLTFSSPTEHAAATAKNTGKAVDLLEEIRDNIAEGGEWGE